MNSRRNKATNETAIRFRTQFAIKLVDDAIATTDPVSLANAMVRVSSLLARETDECVGLGYDDAIDALIMQLARARKELATFKK